MCPSILCNAYFACPSILCNAKFTCSFTAALRKEEERSAKMREKKRLEDEKKAKTAQAKVEAVCSLQTPDLTMVGLDVRRINCLSGER